MGLDKIKARIPSIIVAGLIAVVRIVLLSIFTALCFIEKLALSKKKKAFAKLYRKYVGDLPIIKF